MFWEHIYHVIQGSCVWNEKRNSYDGLGVPCRRPEENHLWKFFSKALLS